DKISLVSKEILTQLLDALLTNRVLNDSEKASIEERTTVTADKARDLIDRVRKKGDKACEIMIEHLRTIDPTLSSELFDPSAQPGELNVFVSCDRIKCVFVNFCC
uniref:CARD domain-containing protein n=1 Tax=Amphilophus citrinellus TaxID=61819 RepID=A0A3Q0QS83_AMPCI